MSFTAQVAAGLVVASTVSTAGTSLAIYRLLHKHDRTLYGEEDVEGWDGLVSQVEQNTEIVEEVQQRR